MNNWNDFVDKKVRVSIAFSSSYVNGGSVPNHYEGVIKTVNEDTIVLADVPRAILKGFAKSETVIVKNMLINKKYIIYIEEI